MNSQDPDEVEIQLPFYFVVKGTPVSFQAASAANKNAWKARVLAAARKVIPEAKFAVERDVSFTIYDFPEERPQGDVDNIVKLIQDALCPHIIRSDSSVVRLVAQRFLPVDIETIADFPPLLEEALIEDPPFIYVRIGDNPNGEAQ